MEFGIAIDRANLHKNADGILVVLLFGSREDQIAGSGELPLRDEENFTTVARADEADKQSEPGPARAAASEARTQILGEKEEKTRDQMFEMTTVFIGFFIISSFFGVRFILSSRKRKKISSSPKQ